ncbi:sulfatase [Haloarcula sp. 1CSR25-25]|uniref:sulfatase family protein n=1 Tax=Haloarcula sp. 1CSR25-25 TaxID=2862545 RepID=UPI00289470A6|nr:sulfatase [Haloarcula sp. 1CSR25-25]MDT3435463.1 sulfatase-like hydrolase/transferase [Haloarcula sp. 1CSR25-25]
MNKPNILFIILDTARGQTVLPGLKNGLMPATGRIASEGTTFRNVSTVAPWTLPSHASLFTGRYTSDHDTHRGSTHFDQAAQPLAARLQKEGYTTVGISGNIWVSPEFGFDAGFDQFSMKWDVFWGGADLSRIRAADGLGPRVRALRSELSFKNAPKTVLNAIYGRYVGNRYDDGAWLTTKRAIRWIEDYQSQSPFFFFINYLEPHLEYNPPEGYTEKFLPAGIDPADVEEVNQDQWRYIAGDETMDEDDFAVLEAMYKGELNYLDLQIAKLYAALSRKGILDETAIVLVSDHGENIGDHGLMDHQYCLYETLLNVPLVIRYPDCFDAGVTVDGLVESRDLYPTLLELAGTNPDPAVDSVSDNSLLPVNGTYTDREYAIAEYVRPQPSMSALEKRLGSLDEQTRRYDRVLRSIRTESWKLIEGSDGTTELYHLAEDPTETTDVSESNPEIIGRLQRILRREQGSLRRRTDDPESISEQSRERLEDLGYI